MSKTFEATLAVRTGEYSGFGTTANPKLSGHWLPMEKLPIRDSWGTGLRVTTFNQLYNGTSEAIFTGATPVDPATCPTGRVDATQPGCVSIRPIIVGGGKADLGPEEAEMASAGFIWEPNANFSIGKDRWNIRREGTNQILSLTQLVDNCALLADPSPARPTAGCWPSTSAGSTPARRRPEASRTCSSPAW